MKLECNMKQRSTRYYSENSGTVEIFRQNYSVGEKENRNTREMRVILHFRNLSQRLCNFTNIVNNNFFISKAINTWF